MSVMIPIWEEEQAPRLGAPSREERRFGLGLAMGGRSAMREELLYGCADEDYEDEEEEEEVSSPLLSPSSSDDEEEHEDEHHLPGSSGSSAAAEPLGSLASLEDSLPTKRGLSSFYPGKSKSFATLADVVTRPTDVSASDLAKTENPFNKRRRVRIMARMRRRASSSSNLPSLLMMRRGMSCGALADAAADEDDEEAEEEEGRLFPPRQELRVLHEEDEHDEDDDGENSGSGSGSGSGSRSPVGPLGFHRAGSGRQLQIGAGGRGFPSPRSFSLTDLHQHHQQHAAAAEFA